MQELTRIRSEEEVWARWLACRWVRRFERGQCGAEEFASGVVSDWGLAISPSDFLERFSWWAEGLFDGAVELVSAVRDQVRVGCLSNTNAIHWARGTSWGLDQLFDLRFLSHELGLVKPNTHKLGSENLNGVGGRARGLRPVAVLGSLYREAGHLALHDPRCRAEPALG